MATTHLTRLWVESLRRLDDRRIRHVYIKPSTPRLNGKVERSYRIDDDEFCRMLAGVVIDDAALFNTKLQQW
jgi:hypothetical protein